MNRAFVTMTACFAIAPGAFAQVVMPPREAPAPTPEYVAPAQRSAPTTVPRPSNLQREIASIKYESLVKLEDGEIVRLSMPVASAALKQNPLVAKLDDETKAEIAEVDRQWRLDVARLAARNVDIIHRIENGAFENLNIEDRDSIGTTMDLIKPLILVDQEMQLSDKLKASGVMTDQAIALNDRMETEYKSALRDEFVAKASQDIDANQGAVFTQSIFYDIVMDAMDSYRFLLEDFAPNARDIFGTMDLDDELKATVAKGAAAIAKADTTEGQLEAARKMMDQLPPMVQRDALLKYIEQVEAQNAG